ncbi:hypothetical protein J6590_016532 [Homalodisca vitripennis]|nr:hypothetical protein J6590_016532 [Homalodisca vitripennis]
MTNNQQNFTQRQDVHNYNTRGAKALNIPKCRLSKSQKCFPVAALTLFNSLPEEKKALNSLKFTSEIYNKLIERPLYSLTELDTTPLF